MLHNRRRDDRLPPSPQASKHPRAKVIDIADAIASKISSRWSPVIRERIYRDFLRGVDPIDLRVNYRDPVFGIPKVWQINAVIREQGIRFKREAERSKYQGLPFIRMAA